MQRADPDIEHYAEALVALGKATGTLDRMGEDAHAACRLLLEDPSVLRFLKDPFIDITGKTNALRELLEDRVCPELQHVLHLLLERGDIECVAAIAERFSAVVAGQDEKSAGSLITAFPLPEETVADIEVEVGRIMQKEVRLRTEIDPRILGGVRVHVGDYVFDDTVVHHLEQMRSALSK